MDRDAVRTKILQFLSSSIETSALDDQDNFFEKKLANSLFALQLVTFVEKAFDIQVEEADLMIENFSSIAAVTDFVVSKVRHLREVRR